MKAQLWKLCAVAMLVACTAAGAQQRDSASSRDTVLDARKLPREIAHEVIDLFNAPSTLRSNGSLNIAPGREVRGDVAVLNGPLTIGGKVTGRVIAINSDVELQPGARLESDLLVVGGAVRGANDAFVGGEIRVYREPLNYRRDGERIVASRRDDDEGEWWRRHRSSRDYRSYSDIEVTSAHTYNRVEGLPIYVGPRIRREFGDARLAVDAYGIFRTMDRIAWETPNLGHLVRAELMGGRNSGVSIGGHLFDVVDPVERWQMSDTEVGLASFLLTRDYRDYYARHGADVFARLFAGRAASLTATFSDERWSDRRDRDPLTLFRSSTAWRPNPQMDEGRLHVGTVSAKYDTRNSEDDPWSGWFLTGDLERGTGRLDVVTPTNALVRTTAAGPIAYNRAFVDLRRYNRIAPDASLNLRVVAGGWLSGDDLPIQRRFSLSGPGALAGYSFRSVPLNDDMLECNVGAALPGHPGLCERMVMAQAEYRGDINFDFDFWDDGDWSNHSSHGDGTWVLFADTGRGWLVGPATGDMQYEKGELPSFRTWRSDIGVGLEFDPVGFYVAKAVSGASKVPPNFFIRLHKRF